jgi:uncharacterized protein YccT (UPF0319 family)
MRETLDPSPARVRVERVTLQGFIIAVGIVLVAASCSSPPTVAAFNAHANSICQTYRPKVRSIDSAIALSSSGNRSELDRSVSAALSQAEQGFAQLEALAQPTGEGSALKRAFNAESDQVQVLNRLATALKDGNENKIQSAETALGESEAPLNQQFDGLGLMDCGSGAVSVSTATG